MRLCRVLCFVLVLLHSGLCKQRQTTNYITDNTIGYFEKVTKITIPIMIHFDKDLSLKLRKIHKYKTISIMRTISKNLVAKVEKLFQRPYLNQTIKLKLLDAKYLKRRMVNDKNVSVYLKNYCKWQGRRKNGKRKYFSVLFTSLDVYSLKNGKKVWSSTGRSYTRGLCSTYHSCTVIEWKGNSIVYLLAHEIAHSLGVGHDGQRRSCPDQKFVMTSQYDPRKNPDTWSVCSRLNLESFLKSDKARCLRTGFEVTK